MQSTWPRLISAPMQMKFPLLAAFLGLLAVSPTHAQTDLQTERATAWKARLSAHIAGYRQFPAEALGQTGEARVTFVIDRSGRLISQALAVSTGSRPLDVAALQIVARAQPFPAPPSELKDESLTLTVPIVFNGRQFQLQPSGLVLSRPGPVLTEEDAMAAWRKVATEHVWRHRVFPSEAMGSDRQCWRHIRDRPLGQIDLARFGGKHRLPAPGCSSSQNGGAKRTISEAASRGQGRPPADYHLHDSRRRATLGRARAVGGRGQIEGQDQQRLPRLLNRVSANKKRRALRRAVFLFDTGLLTPPAPWACGCASCAGRTAPGLPPPTPSPAGTASRSGTRAPGARR
ncbi:TonB family protein [Bradyrhizobium diazoefficiens]